LKDSRVGELLIDSGMLFRRMQDCQSYEVTTRTVQETTVIRAHGAKK